ncbi:MAG: hypothetical protein JSU68_01855 [Phycisphaerales bacterium]|nr:MAG: hypothetical protein JSU68_01855 [Phycisphaerales bacterium]
MTHAVPAPGWAAWYRILEPQARDRESHLVYQVWFADHELTWRGRVRSDRWLLFAPDDIDGDGHWEVLWYCDAFDYDPQAPARNKLVLMAVVRLGETSNEVVWAGLTGFDFHPDANTYYRIVPMWRDEDGDGRKELVFVTREATRSQPGFKKPRTVAVLEWDAARGILRPRGDLKGSGVLPWEPPEGRSLVVDPDEDLRPILMELIRLPQEFLPMREAEPGLDTG